MSMFGYGTGGKTHCANHGPPGKHQEHIGAARGVLRGLRQGKRTIGVFLPCTSTQTILLTEAERKKNGASDLCFIMLNVLLGDFLLVSSHCFSKMQGNTGKHSVLVFCSLCFYPLFPSHVEGSDC